MRKYRLNRESGELCLVKESAPEKTPTLSAEGTEQAEKRAGEPAEVPAPPQESSELLAEGTERAGRTAGESADVPASLPESSELPDAAAPEDGCAVWLMTPDEFAALGEKLPRRKHFLKGLADIQYSKAEVFRDCIQGTVAVPKQLSGHKNTAILFAFYLEGERLLLIEEAQTLQDLLDRFPVIAPGEVTPAGLLQILLETLIADDVLVLQHTEERLGRLEEELGEGTPKRFNLSIMKERRKLSVYHAYYAQLANLGDEMQADLGGRLSREEHAAWQRYTSRVDRLRAHVESLREYIMQLWQLYQSMIDLQQNHVMTILTVVTTIFLPLTLLTGWYGMNFGNIFLISHSEIGYPLLIVLCVVLVVGEIVYFKRKKMF